MPINNELPYRPSRPSEVSSIYQSESKTQPAEFSVRAHHVDIAAHPRSLECAILAGEISDTRDIFARIKRDIASVFIEEEYLEDLPEGMPSFLEWYQQDTTGRTKMPSEEELDTLAFRQYVKFFYPLMTLPDTTIINFIHPPYKDSLCESMERGHHCSIVHTNTDFNTAFQKDATEEEITAEKRTRQTMFEHGIIPSIDATITLGHFRQLAKRLYEVS